MKNEDIRVAVTSRSFSKNRVLRESLLEKYNNVTFNDKGIKLEGNVLIDFLKGHQKAITALEKIDDLLLSELPELQVISKYGVGLDMINMDAMQKHGVRLGWTGGVNKRSVSELVISFAIALLRFVPRSNKEVLLGSWRQHIGRQLSGKKVGVIGCGFIGKDLVKMLQPFKCKIIVYDIIEYKDFNEKYNINFVGLEELLKQSDVVTLHTPLDKYTKNLLSSEMLSLMRADAVLINAARGGLLDEFALKAMLVNGKLAGAALDVFSSEPPEDKELLNLPNFIVTSHIGGSSNEAIINMGMAAIKGLD